MTAINLFTKSQTTAGNPAETQPLIILHGLFGNWENWGSRIRHYAHFSDVHAMDLRNHGDSPHRDSMGYSEMADDVILTLDQLGISSCNLLGHSMGGKVAMRIASIQPKRVARLVVVDIAPKAYPAHHESILRALSAIDINALSSRRDADKELADTVKDPSIRAFLLKNLVRANSQVNDAPTSSSTLAAYHWQFNLQGIHACYPQLMRAPELCAAYQGPCLFVKGAESNYLQDHDRDLVMQAFPRAELKVIGGAGHWPHAEKPAVFDRLVGRFLGFS